MFSFESLHPTVRPYRILRPWLLAAALPLSLAACAGADDTLAPAEETATPAVTVPSEDLAPSGALTTGQRILFMSYRSSTDPDVYKMTPTGTSVVRLAGPTQNESYAAWSYDNKRIAMVRMRTNGGVTHADIYVINADGSNGHWLMPNPIQYAMTDPAWAPNGSRVAVRVWLGNVGYLAWVDVATGQAHLFDTGSGAIVGREPSYSANGKTIVYVGATDKTIEQINADGSNHKTRYTATTSVHYPALSPDGTRLAFDRQVGTNYNLEIHVKNLTTGTVTRLTNSAGDDTQPSWSPDGSRIAFTSGRSGSNQIWTMSPTGASLVRLTHTSTGEQNPAWSH